ncbi:hypothetical protein BH09ACT8_BH09ACT8_42880 [soil metagenome]
MAAHIARTVACVIPLPRAWWLTSSMLVGAAAGVVAAVFSTLLIQASIRPDMVIALVLGVPSVLGLLMVMIAGQRWVTALGAFLIAFAPGWFAVLVLIQVVHGA